MGRTGTVMGVLELLPGQLLGGARAALLIGVVVAASVARAEDPAPKTRALLDEELAKYADHPVMVAQCSTGKEGKNVLILDLYARTGSLACIRDGEMVNGATLSIAPGGPEIDLYGGGLGTQRYVSDAVGELLASEFRLVEPAKHHDIPKSTPARRCKTK